MPQEVSLPQSVWRVTAAAGACDRTVDEGDVLRKSCAFPLVGPESTRRTTAGRDEGDATSRICGSPDTVGADVQLHVVWCGAARVLADGAAFAFFGVIREVRPSLVLQPPDVGIHPAAEAERAAAWVGDPNRSPDDKLAVVADKRV